MLCSFAVNPRWGGQMFSWQLWHQSSEWENLGKETQLIKFSSMTSCTQHAVCNLISHRWNNQSIFHSGTIKETLTSYEGEEKKKRTLTITFMLGYKTHACYSHYTQYTPIRATRITKITNKWTWQRIALRCLKKNSTHGWLHIRKLISIRF